MDNQQSPFGAAYVAEFSAAEPQELQQPQLEEPSFDEAYSSLGGVTPKTVQLPANVTEARSLAGNTDYNGWCQSFAEDMTKSGWKGRSAAEAFGAYQKEGKSTDDLERARPGDLVYFQPDSSNDGDGHVGILTGRGNFISATDNGVQEMPLSDWQSLTGQQIAGVVPLSAIRESN